MTWPKVLALVVPVVVVQGITIATLIRSTMIVHNTMLHAALISNFSRFGDIDPDKLVVIDDSRAYFMRDGSLWTCEVKDDYIIRSTLKVVDVMNMNGPELKEVMAAVDALNMADDDDEDDEDGASA